MSQGGESGGGESRPRSDERAAPGLVRHEEEAHVDVRWEEVGRLGARRGVTSRTVAEEHPRHTEELAYERVPVSEGDSGEIEVLPDGSVSVPLFEEELVVSRRTVLRERVVIRKELVTEWQTVETELKREHIAFDGDEGA